MSLSVEQVRQMREQIKANDAAKTAAQKKTTTQTAKTTPAAPAAKSAGTGLSVAQVAQIRSQMTAAPASTSRLQTTASTPAWTGGTRQVLGTVSADTLGKQVLADMASNTGSPVATDRQEDYEPGWNYVGSDNAPKQRAIAQGTYGSYAKAAQKVGNALAKDRQTDRFDELNQWMDADPRHREVVDLLRQKEYTTQEDKGVAPEQAVQVTGTKQRYSPGDLLKMGYTAQEINEARAYIREYDALPVTDRAVRRTADTTKGIAATVASAVPMAGEMTAQGVKDIRATQKNEAALDKELEGDARGKELKDRITAVDMDYNPQYTDEDLRGMGYSQSEIDEMRSRIAGTVQKTALDKDTSLGYQLYHYGQQRTEAAQAGMSPAAKTAMGVATSAAENLAVAGVSPYLVLPVLSAQGAAESMGQDAEKGTSAGQAVGVGLAKFGAGWAINSVGVADMARSMGVDYARDTVAGKLADLVRSSKLVSGLGNSQLAANTISGGVDNAVQAFVETYADKIIDATLGGDQQAADELLQSDTFLQALQSGLTGGASGALGGAVGTGLGAMSRTLDARAGMETAAPVQVDTESRAADAAAAQRALEERAMEPGEAARQQADQAAAVQQTDNADAAETTAQKDAAPAVRSENPAVQQLAAAMEADALTGKTINLFTPNAANEANRAAFAEEYGMELPATASETRKALRTLARQTRQQAAEAPDTNVGSNAARAENPAADPGQGAVEKAGKTVENGQGYSVSMSNDTMTVRFADGTEAVRTVDPENPRTMLFDPEQLHQQAQAESRAAAQQEAQETTQQSREAPDGLRRTVGLRQQTLTEKQRAVQRTLTDWKVSEGAAETISRMVPDSIADLERYTAAASSMYRMGQMDGVKTFDKALELAGGMNNLAPNTNYVLQQPGGEQALRAAFLQGQGEVEAGTVERGALGGALTDQSTKGEGRVIWKGSDRAADDVAAQVIRLNAAGTGTDAILKSVLLGPDGSPSERVKAYADTETGRIFFGDRNGDVFGTVLHEDYHWYNALDAEGAKAVQNTALEYLAKSEGFENVDELIRDKVKDYAAQGLTYERAAEELVADSWRGIFDSAESVTRWAEFQRAQAEKNADKAGTIHKVMTAVKEMLNGIISRAKEALTLDPENRAALKAQRLAEAEKRALQDAYFAHAEKAMDNLRAAKENAAALKSEGAAKSIRFEIKRDAAGETYIQIDEDILKGVPQENWKSVVKQAIKERFPDGFVRNGWTILNHKDGRNEFVWSKSSKALQWENPTAYADKMRMAANLDEIIATADEVCREPANHKNAEAFNRGQIKIRVGTNAYEADVLTAIKPDTREIFYDIVNIKATKIEASGGTHVESEDSRSRLPETSNQSITQSTVESKENNAAVQKNVRYQLAEQASREAKKNDQRQASRDIANTAAALDTLSQFFGVTRGVKVSQDSLDGLAARWTKANASRADRVKLANETRVLVDYLKADGADMTKAQALAETLAGEVLDGATYRNSELWDEYPELHRLEYTVNKTGKAKAELVKRYGNWSAAVAEARSHGVALRQADGVRDGNPAEQYESIVNDTRAVGGIQDGARALWKAAAQQAGVEGVMSMESTEWLDVLMNLHDSIKPEMRSRFADEAEYEDARVELAGRMIEDVMNVPEMTDAQAIFEGMQKQALQMAKAAAGDEARAAEVEKGMQGVQKVQRQEFARRLAANQRTETRSAVKIDGKTFTNLGDVNEYITYQREEFRRQLKQQEQRLKAQRQEDMDAAKLWYKERMGELREENDYPADQVKQEQRRADRAERSLMIQDNEIMEWEAENERRREAWQQKQAQRNAIALEVARQQRDEDIAIAKKVAENRVQRARDARKADELKRSIRANAAQLNQMVLRPQKGKYVQKGLIVEAAEVAKLANLVTLNSKAVNQLTRLQDSITASMGSEGAPNAMTEDWKQSKVPELIQTLREDLTAAKNARLDKLHEQLVQAEALPDSEKARTLQDRLKARIRDTENRVSLPMTVDQLRLLKAITSSTLHVIRTENKTLSLAKAEEVSAIADAAAYEVKTSKGNRPGGRFDGLRNTLTKYQLDMLGGERVFRMLGGYAKNGQMEKLARMLNDGQRRQSEITIKGEKLFADVTGKTHLKEMDAFAGPGAETVDIGLTDTKGNSVPLNHAMLCSLYMHLQNADSRQHLLNGGLTVPNMEQYTKGNIERAYQEGQTVHLGGLQNADGTPMVDTVLQTVENALTDYDRAWIADMQELFNRYTTNLINETSMQLLGYNRAGVKNYYPIAVDKSALATQIEGLNLDATIEGRGFLKNRVKKAVQPILLEECSNVVQRSIRDTAAYAGLALPIRDVQKVLNSNVETKDGVYNLKNGIIKEQWGRSAVEYVNDLLTDLQTTQRKRDNGVSRMAARLRGNYAGAILTLNPGVAIAQAASLPTAAAVLGSDTMAAVVPFVKNLSAKQRTVLEAEISEHGDVLLEWRKRGSRRGELASIGKAPTLAEKAMDKLPKALTGWINGVDEITVAALWEGSKAYVKNHPGEFSEGAAQEGSEDYWRAVNRMYQKVIEQTQPNYTVMQRAGIQRNPDEFVKTFTMFTTQRFQNYGILADAVMDYNAQKARFEEGETEETKAELQRAGKQLQRAAGSQVAQTAVFALMKIGADFVLHRWDREQDENGDVTLKSLLSRFTGLFTESAAGNFLFGSEVYSLVDNALNGKDYDVVSATNISAVNDLAGDVTKFVSELRKDTADMDEAKLAAHHGKVEKYALTLMEDGLEIAGVPFGNGWKILEAFKGYVQDAVNMFHGGKFTFNSLPSSATGQYDRLYDAYASGDKDEAQAAMEKLQEMGKEEEAYKRLKTRLVKYDDRVQQAAQAKVNSNDSQRQQLTRQVIRDLYEALGIREGAKADADKREAVIDCVTGAVNKRANEVLKGDNDSVTDDLVAAVDSGRAQDVQEELDRLLRAGKSVTNLKNKITEVCKPEYLAGSDYDRQKLEEMLLALTDGDENALYEQKTFATWLKNAEKAQTTTVNDPYADLR
mgnify:CR=1 FL=1